MYSFSLYDIQIDEKLIAIIIKKNFKIQNIERLDIKILYKI